MTVQSESSTPSAAVDTGAEPLTRRSFVGLAGSLALTAGVAQGAGAQSSARLQRISRSSLLYPHPSPTRATRDLSGGNAVSAGTKFLAPLFGLLRQLDRTRPVTLVSVHGGPAEWMAMGDVICTNSYNGWYGTSGRLDDGARQTEKDARPKLAAHRLKALWSQPGAGA